MELTRIRLGLGALGVLVGLYGAFLVLSRQDFGQWVSIVIWLVGGVVVHDAIVGPVVFGLAYAVRTLPRAWRRAMTVAVVILGSLTIFAIPVLGSFGARSDNPTLLDRPYGWSWLGAALLTVILVVAAGILGSRVGGGGGEGAGRR